MRLVETADGSLTAFSARYQDHYHSLAGANLQARELYLRASGVAADKRPRVIELGFGLGVNFFTSLTDVCARDGFLEYVAIEINPVPVKTLETALEKYKGPILENILQKWGRSFTINGKCFELQLMVTDVSNWSPIHEWASAIYFDPFNPKTNPEPWRFNIIDKFYRSTAPGGILVTYSAASAVRKALSLVGYQVEKMQAHGKKRHWTKAIKPERRNDGIKIINKK